MTTKTWTTERVDQLRNCIVAGLTCSQIAAEIGVTRNAVIGKINRLGLSPAQAAGGPTRPNTKHVRRPRLIAQRQFSRLAGAEPSLIAFEITPALASVQSTQRCSLLELTHDMCRWPISNPGKPDVAFCGNTVIEGFSYCAGHARIAYRWPERRRA